MLFLDRNAIEKEFDKEHESLRRLLITELVSEGVRSTVTGLKESEQRFYESIKVLDNFT